MDEPRAGGSDPAPVERTVGPVEGPRPHPRRESGIKTSSRPRSAGPSIAPRQSAPGPPRFARTPAARRQSIFEMAGSSLGAGNPRGHRIPACRSIAVGHGRSGPRPLARRCVLPGIRCEDRGGRVPRSGGAEDAGTVSTMRVPTRERALLPDETRPRGWARGRLRGAPPSLAVARRRLELRQAPERRHVLLLGIPTRDAGARALRRADERPQGGDAAMRAVEVFLSRQLFLERHSGRVMNPEFVRLHYPLYYGYDI